jgi:hypothetical protein
MSSKVRVSVSVKDIANVKVFPDLKGKSIVKVSVKVIFKVNVEVSVKAASTNPTSPCRSLPSHPSPLSAPPRRDLYPQQTKRELSDETALGAVH